MKNIDKAENILDNLNNTKYKVVANYELSKNKNFLVREELSKVHIQQTLDYPKTYYVSALEKVRKSKKDGNSLNKKESVVEYRLSK